MNNHYIGTVIDNNDPQKVGRCKVRIHSLYDSLPVKDLPWIQMMIPLNHDIVFPPAIGKQVICMSLDSHNQNMLITGIVPGINDTTGTVEGGGSGGGSGGGDIKDGPDTSSLARNDADDPPAIITKIDSQRVVSSSLLGNIIRVASFAKAVMDGNWSAALSISGGTTVISDAIKDFSTDVMDSLKEEVGNIFPAGATESDKENLLKGNPVVVDGNSINPTSYQEAASNVFMTSVDVKLVDVSSGSPFTQKLSALIKDPTSVLSSSLTTQALSFFKTPAGAISGITGAHTLEEIPFGYNAVYPNCKVEETKAGWIMTDDTTGMITTIGTDGSYTKILNGTIIQKSVGKTQHVHSDLDVITTGLYSEKSLNRTTVVDGKHEENSTFRNIEATAGRINLLNKITGMPYEDFSGVPLL